MDHEQEVIHHQMEDTRSRLTNKLETLEKQLVDTVQGATQTVENVKDAVTGTVEDVKEAVTGTVEDVKDVVASTVEAVKRTFDIRHQVEQHPLLMFGGSVALGYLAGRLLNRVGSRRDGAAGGGWGGTDYVASRMSAASGTTPATIPTAREEPKEPEQPSDHRGWLASLGDALGPEIDKLKGLALGTGLGLVRDMLTSGLPREIGSQLREVVDDLTTKLGGQTIHNPTGAGEHTPDTGGEHHRHPAAYGAPAAV